MVCDEELQLSCTEEQDADPPLGLAQPSAVVSFDLRVSLYNVRANGRRDYLAVGEDMLPTVYMVRSRGSLSVALVARRSWWRLYET